VYYDELVNLNMCKVEIVLFWDVTEHREVILSPPSSVKRYKNNFLDFLTLEDGTDRLS
jgi:hypothetical protein